jgi:putative ABC transport system substrate-binding protein
LNPATERDFDSTFDQAIQMQAGALAVAADPFFYSQHKRIVALAARRKLPAIYEWREFAEAGG